MLAAHGEASGGCSRRPDADASAGEGGACLRSSSVSVPDRGTLVRRDPHDVGRHHEWTAQAAYGRLAEQAGHPTLSLPLEAHPASGGRAHRLLRLLQASRRLDGDSMVQRLRLGSPFAASEPPVGSDVMPDEGGLASSNNHLFGGEDGRAVVERIDRHIDRLPGLAGRTSLREPSQKSAA